MYFFQWLEVVLTFFLSVEGCSLLDLVNHLWCLEKASGVTTRQVQSAGTVSEVSDR